MTLAATGEMIDAAITSVGGKGGQIASPQAIADAFNSAISAAPRVAATPNRLACLIGQSAQESAWFRTTTEYGAEWKRYDPYRGRGFIQCTWRTNYASFGQWCKNRGLVSDANQFVNNPKTLADLKWAALTSVWYFDTKPGLLAAADQGNFTAVGSLINRGHAGGVPYGNAERLAAVNAALGKTKTAPRITTYAQLENGEIMAITNQDVQRIAKETAKHVWATSTGRGSDRRTTLQMVQQGADLLKAKVGRKNRKTILELIVQAAHPWSQMLGRNPRCATGQMLAEIHQNTKKGR